MENNINVAKGFQHKNYLHFNRLLHFTWSGDLGFLNYISSEKQTITAGEKLADLILFLKKQQIKINIISHSLGNGVLVQAMNLLGEQEKINMIDHAFMWEAAVPNNVFSNRNIQKSFLHFSEIEKAQYRKQQQKNRWYLPFAYKAAKKIVVFYSRNDNILGPQPKQSDNFQKLVDSYKPFEEYLLSKICHYLEIESVYELAIWIGKIPTYFLSSENRKTFYQNWIKKYPFNKYGKPFAKTLDEQIYPSFKDNISLRLKDKKLKEFILFSAQIMGKYNYINLDIISEIIGAKGLEELLTIVDVWFQTRYDPRSALGYNGIDQQDFFMTKLLSSGKLIQVDQSKILFSHSAMKIPTQKLEEEIYKKWIAQNIRD